MKAIHGRFTVVSPQIHMHRRRPEPPSHLGLWTAQYADNRSLYTTEAHFPTPRTFQGAIDWLKSNEDENNYMLWVEVFDPHEPFDCPQEYLDLYEDDWSGPLYYSSSYDRVDPEGPATGHLQRQYAANLTMMDRWLGVFLNELDRQNAWEDTLVIFTTEHGHLLGERGLTGKNKWHAWNELAHIPLLVHLPGDLHAGERRQQLTQNIDILPTVLDYFNVSVPDGIHGESWRNALEADAPLERQAALYGWFGQSVNLTDGHFTYFRAPVREDNQPLFRYFLSPGTFSLRDICPHDFYKDADLGRHLTYTDYPVIRARVDRPRSPEWGSTMLFDIDNDYGQTLNLAGTTIEGHFQSLLANGLAEVNAPEPQYARLGLTDKEG
jgi:arylsulfatase A-like enzyme